MSTPSESAGSSSTAPADRPTFDSLDWSDAAAAPASATPSTPDQTVAPPIAAPEAKSPVTPGEPPQERWPQILENARKKEREAALAEYRQQYGWAEYVDHEAVQQAVRLGQLYQTDRVAFLQQLAQEMEADPAQQKAYRSYLARELARRQAAEPAMPEPDVFAELPNGQRVPVYSVEAQAKRDAILKQQLLNEIRQELTPLQQDREARQKADEEARVQYVAQQVADQYAKQTLSEAEQWPGFTKENRAAMKAAMEADANLSFERAYIRLVVPTLSQKVQAEVMETLNTRAASQALNPSAPAASTTRPAITSFHDKRLSWPKDL